MHDVIGNRRDTEDEKGAILKSRKDIDCRICTGTNPTDCKLDVYSASNL